MLACLEYSVVHFLKFEAISLCFNLFHFSLCYVEVHCISLRLQDFTAAIIFLMHYVKHKNVTTDLAYLSVSSSLCKRSGKNK